jgi:hypothetical protein
MHVGFVRRCARRLPVASYAYSEPARRSYFQVNDPPNILELATVSPKSYTPAHLSCLPGLSTEYHSFRGTAQALIPRTGGARPGRGRQSSARLANSPGVGPARGLSTAAAAQRRRRRAHARPRQARHPQPLWTERMASSRRLVRNCFAAEERATAPRRRALEFVAQEERRLARPHQPTLSQVEASVPYLLLGVHGQTRHRQFWSRSASGAKVHVPQIPTRQVNY